MNKKRSYLSLVIAIAVVFGISACKGTTETSSGDGASATIKATIDSNEQNSFPGAPGSTQR